MKNSIAFLTGFIPAGLIGGLLTWPTFFGQKIPLDAFGQSGGGEILLGWALKAGIVGLIGGLAFVFFMKSRQKSK